MKDLAPETYPVQELLRVWCLTSGDQVSFPQFFGGWEVTTRAPLLEAGSFSCWIMAFLWLLLLNFGGGNRYNGRMLSDEQMSDVFP